jgi:hypothetical protein
VTRKAARLAAMVFTMLAVLASPAAAFTVLNQTGSQGDYLVGDSSGDPGGRCGYGPENSHGVSKLVWVKVFAPAVEARDITAEVDRQQVRWRAKIQLADSETGPWTTVRRSPWEQDRAYEDQAADFHAVKLFHSTSGDRWYRAIVQIQWLHGGAKEGGVTGSIDFYSVKWTVGAPGFVFDGPCWSKAD